MKKPRAEMRKKRRTLKAENKRFKGELECLMKRPVNYEVKNIKPVHLRESIKLDIFEAGLDDATNRVMKIVARRLGEDIMKSGYLKFTMIEDSANRGVVLNGDIQIIPPKFW